MSVKITNSAIDIFKVAGKEGKPERETIILRGVIDPSSFGEIKVDSYQREILSVSKIEELARAIETSTVPDIELGMRGNKTRSGGTDEGNGEVCYLQDEVFVIDGLQRITAAKHLIQKKAGSVPRIGAVIHFDTDFDWERERFRILNKERTSLSVNVLLRNMVKDCESIAMIHKLCTDDGSFVLHGRVSWSQYMARGQIVKALTLCHVVGMLHSRFGPGKSTKYDELARGINTTMERVGRTTMRDNIKTFFELLDECYNVRHIVYTHGAAQIKSGFMMALADVLTRHTNFWRGTRLFIEQPLRQKIKKFPITDPEVQRLATSSGKAREILYSLILEHINSGKRTRRLELAEGVEPMSDEVEEEGAA